MGPNKDQTDDFFHGCWFGAWSWVIYIVGLLIAWCDLGLFSYVIVQGAAKMFFLILSSAVFKGYRVAHAMAQIVESKQWIGGCIHMCIYIYVILKVCYFPGLFSKVIEPT